MVVVEHESQALGERGARLLVRGGDVPGKADVVGAAPVIGIFHRDPREALDGREPVLDLLQHSADGLLLGARRGLELVHGKEDAHRGGSGRSDTAGHRPSLVVGRHHTERTDRRGAQVARGAGSHGARLDGKATGGARSERAEGGDHR